MRKKYYKIITFAAIIFFNILLITNSLFAADNTVTKPISELCRADYDHVIAFNIGSEVTLDSIDELILTMSNCHNYYSVTVNPSNQDFASYSNCLYTKDLTELVCFPPGLKVAQIPKTCVKLLPSSLKCCSRTIRGQVKKAITANNKGVWPGYDMYVHDTKKDAPIQGEVTIIKKQED